MAWRKRRKDAVCRLTVWHDDVCRRVWTGAEEGTGEEEDGGTGRRRAQESSIFYGSIGFAKHERGPRGTCGLKHIVEDFHLLGVGAAHVDDEIDRLGHPFARLKDDKTNLSSETDARRSPLNDLQDRMCGRHYDCYQTTGHGYRMRS
eukprot:1623576-Rhodomonas_salina.2